MRECEDGYENLFFFLCLIPVLDFFMAKKVKARVINIPTSLVDLKPTKRAVFRCLSI